jgi:hypothetical protein
LFASSSSSFCSQIVRAIQKTIDEIQGINCVNCPPIRLCGERIFNRATEANGLGLPVHRGFSLAAKGSTTLTFPAPVIGQSWQLVAACNAPFEGQTVEIGRANGNA